MASNYSLCSEIHIPAKPIDSPKLSLTIIVPAYNEEATIERVVNEVIRIFPTAEIIAVDEGSTDKTALLLKALAKEQPGRLKVLHNLRNSGKGASVCKALTFAMGDLIAIQDADLEVFPEDLLRLVKLFENPDKHMVYGSRVLSNYNSQFRFQLIPSMLLPKLCNILFDAQLTDVSTCYKVFRRSIVERLQSNFPRF